VAEGAIWLAADRQHLDARDGPVKEAHAGLTDPVRAALVCSAILFGSHIGPVAAPVPELRIYFIDVEGGQATLIVSPAGPSLLVDAGWPGFADRDVDRIAAAARDAGITKIDDLLVTHFHADHVGGVPALSRRIPVKTFIDYGAPQEQRAPVPELFKAYDQVRARARQLHPKPGDRLPIAGLDVEVVSAGGATLAKPLAGAGQQNPACAAFAPAADDPTENARSMGFRLEFGAFRFLDLGDLTWNAIGRLICPNNLLGTVSVYLVTHHGQAESNPPALLAALTPQVAILNNGAAKGGAPETFDRLHAAEGLQDVWQLHRATNQAAKNFGEPLIANLDEGQTAYWLKLTAAADGAFTVTNARNAYRRSYQAR
jgi:competence protein ComEC